MTRYRYGDCIGPTCLRDGAHRVRCTNTLGDVGVAGSTANRNPGQRFPYTPLECRAMSVERKIEAATGRLDEALDLRQESLNISGTVRQYSPRKPAAQIADERLGVIAQQDGADALVGSRDENAAERALPDREMD